MNNETHYVAKKIKKQKTKQNPLSKKQQPKNKLKLLR
jgi:hypothetical protein